MKLIGISNHADEVHGLYSTLRLNIPGAQEAAWRGQEAAFGQELLGEVGKAFAPHAKRLDELQAKLAKAAEGRKALEAQRAALLDRQRAARHLHFGQALSERLASLGEEVAALEGRLSTAAEAEREAAWSLRQARKAAAASWKELLADAARRRLAALKVALARHGRDAAEKVAADVLAYLTAQAEAERLGDPDQLAAAAKAGLGKMGLAAEDVPTAPRAPRVGEVVYDEAEQPVNLAAPVPAVVTRVPGKDFLPPAPGKSEDDLSRPVPPAVITVPGQ